MFCSSHWLCCCSKQRATHTRCCLFFEWRHWFFSSFQKPFWINCARCVFSFLCVCFLITHIFFLFLTSLPSIHSCQTFTFHFNIRLHTFLPPSSPSSPSFLSSPLHLIHHISLSPPFRTGAAVDIEKNKTKPYSAATHRPEREKRILSSGFLVSVNLQVVDLIRYFALFLSLSLRSCVCVQFPNTFHHHHNQLDSILTQTH